ncbi:MAG: hypothetical protein J7518_00050 [Nocardioidaceae bacterium]|nr:hypothetical protein [Nocardioidaceae bacterium]
MRPSRVVSLAVPAALLLSAALTGGAPASATDRATDRDRARAEALLAQVQAALTPGSAHRRTDGVAPRRDATLLLRRLRVERSHLSARGQAQADLVLSRPNGSEKCSTGLLSPPVVKSAHFCVHYASGGSADWARRTSAVLEQVFATEVNRLGYRAPLPDSDGLFDVYLQQLGDQGYYGYCTTDHPAAKSSAFCVLDNDFSVREFGAPPESSLAVTAAHEFFHAIQFAYDADQQSWLMEGSAVWMEDVVFPQINDYLQYLPFSAIRHPGLSVDLSQSPWHYGAVLFFKFLSESLRDPGVIRQVWTYADASTGRTALQAVRTALAVRHRGFATSFARFAAWNTKPSGSYGDRALFPATAWNLVLTMTRPGADSGWRRFVLNHLSSANSLVRPARTTPRTARLRISVNGPAAATAPVALVQVRLRTGAVGYASVPLNGRGDGSRVVSFNPRRVSAVVVTTSNAGGTNSQPFLVRFRVLR